MLSLSCYRGAKPYNMKRPLAEHWIVSVGNVEKRATLVDKVLLAGVVDWTYDDLSLHWHRLHPCLERAGTKACQFCVPSCHSFYTHSVPLNPEVNVGVFFHIAPTAPLRDKNGYMTDIKSICLTYLLQYYQMVLIVCVIYYIEYYTHTI